MRKTAKEVFIRLFLTAKHGVDSAVRQGIAHCFRHSVDCRCSAASIAGAILFVIQILRTLVRGYFHAPELLNLLENTK